MIFRDEPLVLLEKQNEDMLVLLEKQTEDMLVLLKNDRLKK